MGQVDVERLALRRSRMGPKSTRVPQEKCTSRCACTAAAAPWTPSFRYAFAANTRRKGLPVNG